MDELDDAAIDRVLSREGYGFLAMSADDVPYVVPMSFGYDGEDCFCQMSTRGRKNEVLGANDRVSLAVLSIDPDAGISESVLVEGTLAEVPPNDLEDAMATLAANAEFGTDLEVWGVPVQEVDLAVYRLDVVSRTGRRFGADLRTD